MQPYKNLGNKVTVLVSKHKQNIKPLCQP